MIEKDAGIAMDARPETLSPLKFIELARALRKRNVPALAGDLPENDTGGWE